MNWRPWSDLSCLRTMLHSSKSTTKSHGSTDSIEYNHIVSPSLALFHMTSKLFQPPGSSLYIFKPVTTISLVEGISGIDPFMTLPPIAIFISSWNSFIFRIPSGIEAFIVGLPSVNHNSFFSLQSHANPYRWWSEFGSKASFKTLCFCQSCSLKWPQCRQVPFKGIAFQPSAMSISPSSGQLNGALGSSHRANQIPSTEAWRTSLDQSINHI